MDPDIGAPHDLGPVSFPRGERAVLASRDQEPWPGPSGLRMTTPGRAEDQLPVWLEPRLKSLSLGELFSVSLLPPLPCGDGHSEFESTRNGSAFYVDMGLTGPQR